jgi:hypothetical protein
VPLGLLLLVADRSLNFRFVARDTFASFVPPPVVLISGSDPTLPMSMTLLRDRLMLPPCCG